MTDWEGRLPPLICLHRIALATRGQAPMPATKGEQQDQKDNNPGRDSPDAVTIVNNGFRHNGLPLFVLRKGK